MNKLLPWLKVATIAVALSAVSSKAAATEFVIAYDGFYDRLKVVNKGEFQYALSKVTPSAASRSMDGVCTSGCP